MDREQSGSRAVSPVVGAALVLVIVVALGVLTAGMVLQFEGQLRDPAPVLSNEESVEVALQGNDTRHTLEFVHRAGQSVDADALRVRVGSGGAAETITLDSGSAPALSDGAWSAGEKLRLDLDESTVCSGGGDAAAVSLVYESEQSAYRLSERRVPVERGQFVIDGDSVRTTADFTANVKFLGTGWSSAYYDAPVNVSVRVDGTEVTAWEMVGDADSTVGAHGVSRQSAGTTISVAARGKAGPNAGWRTTSESENADYLVVLRDGDDVPNYDAGAGQQDVAAYAEPFIENGTVSLDDNQAIYLFDFNRQGTDDGTADYQDAVVLVSFFTRQTSGPEVHETSEAREVIVCPAESRSASPNGGGGGNGGGNGAGGNGGTGSGN